MPFIDPVQWFGPAVGPGAFVVCDSYAHDGVDPAIFCMDPHAARGIRWSISRARLRARLGGTAEHIVPIFAPGTRAPLLPVLIDIDSENAAAYVFVVVVDTRNGALSKVIPLRNVDRAPTATPVIASDGRLIAYQYEVNSRPLFTILDVKRGTVVDQHYTPAELGYAAAFAITSDSKLLISDQARIWEISLHPANRWQSRLVFDLRNGSSPSCRN